MAFGITARLETPVFFLIQLAASGVSATIACRRRYATFRSQDQARPMCAVDGFARSAPMVTKFRPSAANAVRMLAVFIIASVASGRSERNILRSARIRRRLLATATSRLEL